MLPYALLMLLVVGAGVAIGLRAAGDGIAYSLGRQVRRLVDATSDRFTPFGAAVILGAACTSAASVLAYLLGLITRHTGAFDLAVFRWTSVRLEEAGQGQAAGSLYPTWSRAAQLMTDPGNKHQIWVVTTICAVALAIAYRRRFWVPVLVLFAAIVSQHYLQIWIADAVDRGHPPTTLGTYPSGGVARIIAIYGLVAFLALIRFTPGRRLAVTAWTVVALLAAQESYSRWFLEKHWLTDIVGGVIFGLVLLAAYCIATLALEARRGNAVRRDRNQATGAVVVRA
jgi:hypothetical protein